MSYSLMAEGRWTLVVAYNADINGNRGISSQTVNFRFLDDPQKLGLQVNFHFTDLIQEQCSGVGQLEFPQLSLRCAGKSPLFVTEHFTFEKIVRNGCTINGNKGLVSDDCYGGEYISPAALFPCRFLLES